jgi:glucokinase
LHRPCGPERRGPLSPRCVLVGDVGGTNTRLGLWVEGEGLVRKLTRPTSETATLRDAIARFEPGPIDAGCVAVAGPVDGDQATLTNADWSAHVDHFSAPGRLVNDLEAAAAGLNQLSGDGLDRLRGAAPDPLGTAVILGLGTGLGQAIRGPAGVLAGEGGHKTFGPADAEQWALWQFLADLLQRPPTWEDVLAGAGLDRVYRFLGGEVDPVTGVAKLRVTDHPADPMCAAAAALYCRCAAVEARNLGLQVLASGGVWLGGGMPARFPRETWRAALETHFVLPGLMASRAAALPVLIARDPDLALLGAAALAPTRS